MIARTFTAQPGVLAGDIITIEVDWQERDKNSEYTIVGLAGKAVDEAKDRVGSALFNSKLQSPTIGAQRVIISLAPADIKKDGPLFDLPIAISYLIARGKIKTSVEKTLLVGELSLDGTLRPVRGVLPIVEAGRRAGFTEVIVPYENREESALVHGIDTYGARNLREVVYHLAKESEWHVPIVKSPRTEIDEVWTDSLIALEDVRGQESAKRGLIIAAAGKHNSILVGPPGTGKTMLARAFQGILPPLTPDEALEVTAIHSVAGTLRGNITTVPPFRAPHHSSSHVALVGGGSVPRPGEVTLAHNGVLFLDEFPEFERRSIDGLRQPLEDRLVTISRANSTAQFPANFILVAAMNPSRGGDSGDDYTAQMLETYKNKISGPILDRIDLWLPVPHIDYETLSKINTQKDETKRAREQIAAARAIQAERFKDFPIRANAEMSAKILDTVIELSPDVRELLKNSAAKMKLSPRSYHRLIKTSRTIADLAGSADITAHHVMEALQYRVQS